MKLSKRDVKKQKTIFDHIYTASTLSHDDIEYFYTEANEGYLGDVTHNSAFFTPPDYAADFALMVPTHGTVVDVCAGFGVLTYYAKCRDTYEQNIKHYICIEQNPKYIEIGKKLCPFATWIQTDCFDKSLWDKIIREYGNKNNRIDCLLSNPPFGTTTPISSNQKQWLKYKGKDFEMAVIELGITVAEYSSYIVPQNSCTFRCSGEYAGFKHVENKKVDRLKKDIGKDFYMEWPSLDTSVYSEFKNTKIRTECFTISQETVL